MPEGDTIHKLARLLHRSLAGARVERLWLRDRGLLPDFVGAELREVRALGKHLLMPLTAGHGRFVLHTHLGMKGRWDRYSPEASWRRSPNQAGVQLGIGGRDYICFRPMLVELFRRDELLRHPSLARLGPDLLDPAASLAGVVARARSREARSVTDLLLDQRVACGLGNEYRNEILFLRGLHPETRSDALSDGSILALFELGRELLQNNLGGWKRTTTRKVSPEEPLRPGESRCFVQGRAGQPCLVCQSEILAGRVGDAARATYWCPSCQPKPGCKAKAQKETGRPLSRTPGVSYALLED